ncbi:uncharacterized protein BX663DRAFT_527278, partial [Cokeromyces recurvatus]|uniref:uncharacterized protein n=1 Tax=Cokeromyces recurvatus TaxID=90255 RepID=UPI002220A9C1
MLFFIFALFFKIGLSLLLVFTTHTILFLPPQCDHYPGSFMSFLNTVNYFNLIYSIYYV